MLWFQYKNILITPIILFNNSLMEDEIIIDYERTKSEAKQIYLKRIWLKRVIPNIIIGVLLIPCWVMLGMAFGVSVDNTLGLDNKTSSFFSILMIIGIFYYFLAPVYRLYKSFQFQINFNFGNEDLIHNSIHLYKDKFINKNNNFYIEGLWENTKWVGLDKDYLIFQLKMANILFFIPTKKLTPDVRSFLNNTIPKK